MKNAIIAFVIFTGAFFLSMTSAISQENAHGGRIVEAFPYPYKNLLFVSPRFDRQNLKGGDYFNTYLLRTVFTDKGSSHFRVDIPLANSNTSGSNVFGLADMNLRYVHAIPLHGLSNRLYGGISLEAVLPTATDKSLGSGKWQAWPGIGAVYFRGDDKNVSGTVSFMCEYRFSYAGSRDRSDVRVLAFAPNIDWWFKKGYIGYYATWTYNFENEVFDLPVDVEAGYFLSSRFVLSAEYIQPLIKKRVYNNEFAVKLRCNF